MESFCDVWQSKLGIGSWHKKYAVLNENNVIEFFDNSEKNSSKLMIHLDISKLVLKKRSTHKLQIFNGISKVFLRFK